MNIISYYPTFEELDSLRESHPKANSLNIFLDLKNSLGLLYVKNVAENLLEISNNTGKPNSMIFLSWLDFIMFHYDYAIKNNINIRIITYADVGEYQYHKAIYKEYKSNRSITKKRTTSDLCESEDFHKIVLSNIETIMRACKKLYHTKGVYLSFCESDFVPEYYISEYFTDDKYLNIIYSSDRDYVQTLRFHNTVQFVKKSNHEREFIDYNNWVKVILDKHTKKLSEEDLKGLDVDKYIYIKSIMGDIGDGIPGVGGMGPIKAASYINEVCKNANIDSVEKLIEYATEHIEEPSTVGTWNKTIEDKKSILYRNYRLMSFQELISSLSLPTIEKLIKKEEDHLTLEESIDTIQMMREKLKLW
jgi:5'-3' exonuclease